MHKYLSCLLAASALSTFMIAGSGCQNKATEEGQTIAQPLDKGEVFNLADDALTPPTTPTIPTDPAKVLVTVEGKSLTSGEVDKMTQQMLRAQGVPEEQMAIVMQQMGGQLRGRMVEQFIAANLLAAEAKRCDITVSDAEIDAAVAKISERLPPNLTLEAALQQMGTDVAQMRKEISDNEAIRKLYESETANVSEADEAEIAEFYAANRDRFAKDEEVTARHILIACDENDSADKQQAAKSKAEALRKELVEGADFAKLAAENSDCPSKAKGGSLGSFGRGQMVPPFEEAAFALKPNDISDVVKTQFGYHIIQVSEHHKAGEQALDDVKETLKPQLTAQKRNQHFEKFIDELKKSAKIEYSEELAPTGDAVEPSPTEAVESSQTDNVETSQADAEEASQEIDS